MIRINRDSEDASCPQLAEVREAELDRVRHAIPSDGRANDDLLGKRYKVARGALFASQHGKCCYCEQSQQSESYCHVEHYRCKSIYWWLTWTWDNLLLSCDHCNTSKHDEFPIEPGSTRLVAEGQPPGDERALLIHPAQEDPREHLEFVPAAGFWYPRPRAGSDRGKHTLRVLKWDRTGEAFPKPGLLESWKRRAADLQACISAIEAAIESSDGERIRGIWERHTYRFRVDRAEFVALSLDILDRSFPGHVRRRWGLSLDLIVTAQA
jgi:uncharacterized protein (TIGR02646 family)